MNKETFAEQVEAIRDSRFLDPYQTRLRTLVLSMYEAISELQQEIKDLRNEQIQSIPIKFKHGAIDNEQESSD